MRMFTDAAIITAKEDAQKLFVKLANTVPDEKLTRDDIRDLMFILREYEDELDHIAYDRKKRR